MNCDEDFYIPFENTYVKVKPFCTSSTIHYMVYLPQGEVKIVLKNGDDGSTYWHEFEKGETDLSRKLGSLIASIQPPK